MVKILNIKTNAQELVLNINTKKIWTQLALTNFCSKQHFAAWHLTGI
jgi:hypothetical protein